MAENNITTTVSNAYSNLPFIIIPILGVASNVLLLVAFIKDPLKCFRNISCNEPVSFRPPHTFIRSIFHQQGNNRLAAPDFWISRSVVQAFLSCIITSISIDRFLMVAYPIKHRILMRGKVVVLWLTAISIVRCVLSGLRLYTSIVVRKN
jgi:hypothetical protein